jgi:phage terminase small subunit
LSGYALDEWRRITPLLQAMGLLTVLDINILAIYYVQWREAEEKLAEAREKDPETRGLLIDGKANPLLKTARNAAHCALRPNSA